MPLPGRFPGGIHPPAHKERSSQPPIRPLPLPAVLTLPLRQHNGTPATPCVEVGDRVMKGQCIALAGGTSSLPVHAPTSGQIDAIIDHPLPHPSGLSERCIRLVPDGNDRWIDHQGIGDYQTLTPLQLVERIRDAGIAGLGGAGFPTAAKLRSGVESVIHTLILNGAECEPYISCDDRLMRERADQIVDGAEILAFVTRPQSILIAIEDDKPDAIAAMQAASAGRKVEIVVIPTRYPSGGEKQLIQILTGREVPSGGLPADIGVICQNVATAAAVHRAIRHGEPLLSRIVTVTGDGVDDPGNVEVLIGTPFSDLLTQARENQHLSRLICGGPLMGFTLPSANVPVTKTSACLIAATTLELPTPPPARACIRCSYCADACPAGLLPQQLFWFARAEEWDKAETYNLFDCIECGACAYVCPSDIPLVQHYRHAKGEIRARREEKAKADLARLRFEAHQERVQREAQEKDVRRRARAEALAQRSDVNKSTAATDAMQNAASDKAAKAAAVRAAVARQQQRTATDEATVKRKQLANAEERLKELQGTLAEVDADSDPRRHTRLLDAIARQDARIASLRAATGASAEGDDHA